MNVTLDETHSVDQKSWVESAESGATDFPIQNLPLGRFRCTDSEDDARLGLAIGDLIFDLRRAATAGLFEDLSSELLQATSAGDANALLALGPTAWSALRRRASELLRHGSSREGRAESCLVPQQDAEMLVPARIGDYTDFYASVHHATNVGRLFRPDNPLLPNYRHIPIGYHGRASSIVASGTPIRRPSGQRKRPDDDAPQFGPARLLDYELEVGFYVGPGNELGTPISIDEAAQHIYGLCLVNDWSARDLQAWEYQPLGPFLSKSFATSLSPWIVSLEALAPFRVAALARSDDEPAPLAYLLSSEDQESGGFDITVEAWLRTPAMVNSGTAAVRLSRGSFRDMYWTIAQMLTHHASAGCNLKPGDLLASGTVSGPRDEARGCLLEITRRGADPVELPSGETRHFLEDGDEVILRGYCEAKGHARIGFGECRGIVGA